MSDDEIATLREENTRLNESIKNFENSLQILQRENENLNATIKRQKVDIAQKDSKIRKKNEQLIVQESKISVAADVRRLRKEWAETQKSTLTKLIDIGENLTALLNSCEALNSKLKKRKRVTVAMGGDLQTNALLTAKEFIELKTRCLRYISVRLDAESTLVDKCEAIGIRERVV